MALPPNCGGCGFRRQGQSPCRRHAPSPAEEEFLLTHWPPVRETDRCGDGTDAGESDAQVRCGRCVHWYLPNGEVLAPPVRYGRSRDWWGQAALCTRSAPSPGGDEHRRVFWRVTHESEGCGDGEAVPVE